jgi:hypothetical protein
MQSFSLKDRHRPRPPHSNSLQVLRAHHGPRASTRRLSSAIIRNTGVAHQAFAHRPYARRTRAASQVYFDLVLCRRCTQAQIGGSVANSTTPSWITKRHGKALLPVRIRASQPAFLSSVAIKLDASESPIQPVRGDLVRTANLLDVVRRVPTNGLPAKIRGLAGSKGSTPGGQYV